MSQRADRFKALRMRRNAIDTERLLSFLHEELREMHVSQTDFAIGVLERKRGCCSDIFRSSRSWVDSSSTRRRILEKIYDWLMLSDDERNAVLPKKKKPEMTKEEEERIEKSVEEILAAAIRRRSAEESANKAISSVAEEVQKTAKLPSDQQPTPILTDVKVKPEETFEGPSTSSAPFPSIKNTRQEQKSFYVDNLLSQIMEKQGFPPPPLPPNPNPLEAVVKQEPAELIQPKSGMVEQSNYSEASVPVDTQLNRFSDHHRPQDAPNKLDDFPAESSSLIAKERERATAPKRRFSVCCKENSPTIEDEQEDVEHLCDGPTEMSSEHSNGDASTHSAELFARPSEVAPAPNSRAQTVEEKENHPEMTEKGTRRPERQRLLTESQAPPRKKKGLADEKPEPTPEEEAAMKQSVEEMVAKIKRDNPDCFPPPVSEVPVEKDHSAKDQNDLSKKRERTSLNASRTEPTEKTIDESAKNLEEPQIPTSTTQEKSESQPNQAQMEEEARQRAARDLALAAMIAEELALKKKREQELARQKSESIIVKLLEAPREPAVKPTRQRQAPPLKKTRRTEQKNPSNRVPVAQDKSDMGVMTLLTKPTTSQRSLPAVSVPPPSRKSGVLQARNAQSAQFKSPEPKSKLTPEQEDEIDMHIADITMTLKLKDPTYQIDPKLVVSNKFLASILARVKADPDYVYKSVREEMAERVEDPTPETETVQTPEKPSEDPLMTSLKEAIASEVGQLNAQLFEKISKAINDSSKTVMDKIEATAPEGPTTKGTFLVGLKNLLTKMDSREMDGMIRRIETLIRKPEKPLPIAAILKMLDLGLTIMEHDD
ncbi:unnamed protein product [Caenorhabditis sp. 36 PRJEB53466]|nr:unnamed protein product [Caenorhabditis sp. 36 PRJEB53466]